MVRPVLSTPYNKLLHPTRPGVASIVARCRLAS
jgi:hypothetical protein